MSGHPRPGPGRWGLAALLGIAACHPTRKEYAAMVREVSALRNQQVEDQTRIDALEGEQRRVQRDLEQASVERHRIRTSSDGLVDRVASLEDRSAQEAKLRARRPDPGVRYRVDLGPAPIRGAKGAEITIVMWGDFQCPFTRRSLATLDELEAHHRGQIRIAFKHNPLPMHPRAMAAALAAEAANRQGKFWKMHDLLFEHQRRLEDADLRRYARQLHLDVDRFRRDLADPALRRRVEADQRQADALGARGTPAFFVNGRFLSGAQPTPVFERLVEAELEEARIRIDDGTAKSELYDALMQEATAPPHPAVEEHGASSGPTP